MAAENVHRAAKRGQLQSYYPVMKIDTKTNIMYFVTVEDPGNQVYANWLTLIAGERFGELGITNQERLADIVEAGMGLCYLASVFPVQLHNHLARPNELWRMMETSLITAWGSGHIQYFGPQTKRKCVSGPHHSFSLDTLR